MQLFKKSCTITYVHLYSEGTATQPLHRYALIPLWQYTFAFRLQIADAFGRSRCMHFKYTPKN